MEEEEVAEQEVVLHVKKIWVILHSGSSRTENSLDNIATLFLLLFTLL